MDDILNIQDDNFGGNAALKFAPVYFFTSLSPITFAAGYDWITVACTSETVPFSETTVPDENGGYQQIDITGTVPGIRPDVHAILLKYRSPVKLIVWCQDMNGNTRLAGTIGEGMELIDKSTTGAAMADSNGYSFQFTGQQRKPALFL